MTLAHRPRLPLASHRLSPLAPKTMAYDPILEAHKRWLGYLQPVGLVVSPHALVAAQAVPSANVQGLQRRLQAILSAPPGPGEAPAFRPLRDLPALLTEALRSSLQPHLKHHSFGQSSTQ